MKRLKIAGVSILAVGLVLGLALPATADADLAPPQASNIPPKVLAGKVVSLDAGQASFVIQSRGQEFTILVDGDTKYFKVPPPRRVLPLDGNRPELRPMPQQAPGLARHRAGLMGRFPPLGEEATFDDITVGARVVVRVVPEGDNLVAKLVLIIIKPPAPNRVIGTITDISLVDKTITIAPADGGDDITLNYNGRTRFILRGIPNLEEGQSTRAVYDREMVAKVVFAPIEVPEPAD